MNASESTGPSAASRSPLSCVLVSADESVRLLLERHIEHSDFLQLASYARTEESAAQLLALHRPDLIFWDTEFPKEDPLDILVNLTYAPVMVLITDEAQAERIAPALQFIHRLYKPITFARFSKAALQAQEERDKLAGGQASSFLYVKADHQLLTLNLHEICWIEAIGDYVQVQTTGRRLTLHATMKALELRLGQRGFLRVHRSFIINPRFVTQADEISLLISSRRIPIGRSYKSGLALIRNTSA